MSAASIALHRFGYGPKPGEPVPVDPVRHLLGQIEAYVPAPAPIASREHLSGAAARMLNQLRRQRDRLSGSGKGTADMNAMAEMAGRGDNPALAGLPPELIAKFAEGRKVVVADIARRIEVATTTPAPFAERLVHFWSNHFSVSVGKPGTQQEVGHHEFTAIRPHVFGRFGDMLKAAVLHPAMLLYLDQFQSLGPDSQALKWRARRGGERPQRGLNENLAREILELHTLGVDAGYNQTDVTELARALTGWTLPGIGPVGRFAEPQASGAAFVALAHQPGTRTIVGRSYPDTGAAQALAVLGDLAVHPATARHVATKLARHFAGDTPPPALVDRLAADFLRTGGDLGSMARVLVESPETWAPGPVKFRAPFEWLVSALRVTGIGPLEPARLAGMLDQLGQVPWRATSPAGYDDVAASWAGPDAIFRRVMLAERLTRSQPPADDVIARAEAVFPGTLGQTTRLALSRAESGTQALSLLLVSPEMMRR